MLIKLTQLFFIKAIILASIATNAFAESSTIGGIFGIDDNQDRVPLETNEICAYPETAIRLQSTAGKKGIWRVRTIRRDYRSIRDHRSAIGLKKDNNGQAYVLLKDFYEQVEVQVFDRYTKVGTVLVSNPYLSSSCQWGPLVNPSLDKAYEELGIDRGKDSDSNYANYSWRNSGDESVNFDSGRSYVGPYKGVCRVGDRYTDYYPQGATAYKETGDGPWIITGCS